MRSREDRIEELRRNGSEALARWRATKTKEELSQIAREARAMQKTNSGAFKAGDPRTRLAGQKGGLRSRLKEKTNG